jgi:isoleucyl-tRNA synthetase
MQVSGCLSEKGALNNCANKLYVRSGWKAVQWCFQTRTKLLASEIWALVHKRTPAVVVALEVLNFKGAFEI